MDAITLKRMADSAFNYLERKNQEPVWREISRYILMENVGNFLGVLTPGIRKTWGIFDGEGIRAHKDLASSFHTTLTNPATKWFSLPFKDEKLNQDYESVQWMQNSVDKMFDRLSQSNFYTEIAKDYIHYVALGNSILLQEEDFEGERFNGFYFKTIHLSEIVWTENKKGVPDCTYRKFKLTPRQFAETFEIVPEHVRHKMEHSPEERIEVLHVICPNVDYSEERKESYIESKEERDFLSVYIDVESVTELQRDGYYEHPIMVSRWSLAPSEIYGTGPGHVALPDIKTLNKFIQLDLEMRSRAVDPPYLTSDRNIVANLDLRPGHINVVRNIEDIKALPPEVQFQAIDATIERLAANIQKSFFLDKLALPPREDTGSMTAYETSQRIEQMTRALGAVVSRYEQEKLKPMIGRQFQIQFRNGDFEPLPPMLKKRGLDVDVVFTNQLARSQRMQDVSAIQSWIQDLSMLFQIKPEVADYIDSDGIAKHMAEVSGVPQIALMKDDAVVQLRQQRQQQMQQTQQAELQNKQADTNSKNAKSTRPGGGNSSGLTQGAPVQTLNNITQGGPQ